MTDAMKPSARYVVHAAGLLLVLAGLVTWGRLLSRPDAPTAMASARTTEAADPTAEGLAAWFGPGELRADVVVKGLIKGADHAVAVLAVNNAPPRPYRVGESLARSVTLTAIENGAVVIDKAGTSQRIAAPVIPPLPTPGIVRAGL